MTPELISDLLLKVKFKEGSLSHKIARIILESDNKPFTEVLTRIVDMSGTCNILYARTRYYQVRKRIEDCTDLKVSMVVKKYVSIGKK